MNTCGVLYIVIIVLTAMVGRADAGVIVYFWDKYTRDVFVESLVPPT